MDPNAGEPVKPGGTTPDISRVEGLVAAAQQEAAAAQTPKVQFENQFGSLVAPHAVESTPDIDTVLASLETSQQTQPPSAEGQDSTSVASLDPSIKTVDNLLAKGPQVVESQSEVKLPPEVQEFLDSVLNAAKKFQTSKEEKDAVSF